MPPHASEMGVTGEPATVVGVKWVSRETEALGWIGGWDSDITGLESDWVGSVGAPTHR